MTENALPTVPEAVEQLTGYDEIAIEKHFGADLDKLRNTTSLRALIFVDRRRSGLSDKDAYEQAMKLSIKQLGDEFTPEDDADEVVPGQPVSPAGEGDASAS